MTAFLLWAAPVACAAELRVVTSGAFTAAYLELTPEYERITDNKLFSEFGPSMETTHNAIPVRLGRGEVIDVVMMAAPALENQLTVELSLPDDECKSRGDAAGLRSAQIAFVHNSGVEGQSVFTGSIARTNTCAQHWVVVHPRQPAPF